MKSNTDKAFFRFFWLTVLCMLVNLLMCFLSHAPYCWYHLGLAAINGLTIRFLWVVSPMFFLGFDAMQKEFADVADKLDMIDDNETSEIDETPVMCIECKDVHLYGERYMGCPKCRTTKGFIVQSKK